MALVKLPENNIQVGIKSPILPRLVSFWCSYHNIWTYFYVLYERVRDLARRTSITKMFLKILQYSHENLHQSLICNEAAVWRPATSLNRDPVSLWILRTSILQASARACFQRVRTLLEFLYIKFQVFTINRTENCFTIKKLQHIFPRKFLKE